MKQRTRIIAGLIGIVFVLLACGSDQATLAPAKITTGTAAPSGGAGAGSATIAPAAPVIGKPGDRIEQDGMALTLVNVEEKTELNQFSKAKDGSVFKVVEVVIENVSSDKEVSYNPFYFKVKDADGFEYNASTSPENSLSSGKLTKGDKARGFLAFEVKIAAKDIVMSYEPLRMSGGPPPIKFSLAP